jgi:hypothetical protein
MTQFSSLYGRLLTQELGSEDSTVLFTDARRKAGINDGLQEFADLTECLVRTSTITVTGGTREYDLNAMSSGEFVRLAPKQSVEFHYTDASSRTQYLSGPDLPQVTLQWLDAHEPGWRNSTAISSGGVLPQRYYLRPDGPALFMGFEPCPSTGSSASAQVLVPWISRAPSLTSDTAEPYTVNSSVRTDLRVYHIAAVHYAAHQLEKLRRDDQASDRQLQKFLGYVTRYLQSTRQKAGQTLTYTKHYFRRRESVRDPRV